MVDGTAVLADLSGFTRLTESLVARGPEGVELLHRSLTTCFGALLGSSLELGGDVLGFAGDAALVWFGGDDHVERAARAAAAMPRDLGAVPAALTARTRLRASIGLHTGRFLAVELRVGDRRGVTLCGPEMSRLARLEHAAESEQVLMSPATAAVLPPAWSASSNDDGVVLDRRRVRQTSTPTVDPPAEGSGEHRVASVGFVMVPGLDALFAADGPDAVADRVRQVADVVGAVADAHAVTVIDTDVGVDCVKFYVAAGVPRAVDGDDARLLLALRRILDESPVALRAGAQRGRVFSALLGVRDRLALTALGDTVNVAARALGTALDGDLVVADGLTAGLERWVTATSIGAQHLKNRVAPMPMWRVHTVTAAPRTRPRASESMVDRFRRREWDQLVALWKETADGGGASAAIIGEPGMGATELVASLGDVAGGGAVSIVADRFLHDVPYSGIDALVAAMAANTGEHATDPLEWLGGFRDQLPAGLREWTPAALDLVRGAPTAGVEPGTAARRARQVLIGLITAAAPPHWLLAVEDANHLDDASLQVLIGLIAQATGSSHLVVTTHEHADALSAAADVSVTLEPLADDVVTRALHELAPQLRDDEIARLVATAGGNPLVLSGLLERAPADQLPDSIQQLAAVIVDALPEQVRSLVLDAAVFGREFDAADVAAVLGDDTLASPMIWRQAERVLRTNDERVWRFRHEAYRDVAYRTPSYARRRHIHSAIADRLVGVDGDAGIVALHLQAAGRTAEAYPRALDAARSARARGALSTAVDLFERAVTMARRHDPLAVGPLLVELGQTRVKAGDLDGALAAFRSAGRARLDVELRAAVHCERADIAVRRGRLGPAARSIEQARSLVDPASSPTMAARATLTEVVVLDRRGRRDDAIAAARRALVFAERAEALPLMARAHLQLEAMLFERMDPQALDHGRTLIDLASRVGDDHLLDMALNNTGLTAMYLGRWEEALTQYRRARAHAERCGHVADAAAVDQNIGFLLYRRRRLDDAEALARESRRVLRTVQDDTRASISTLLLAMIDIARDRFDEAAVWLDEARTHLDALNDTAMVVDCDVVGMDLLVRRGRAADAIARAAEIAPRLVHAEPEVSISFERILGAAERSPDRVRDALARARDLQLVYEVYLCLGALAVITGDADARAEHEALRTSLGIVTSG